MTTPTSKGAFVVALQSAARGAAQAATEAAQEMAAFLESTAAKVEKAVANTVEGDATAAANYKKLGAGDTPNLNGPAGRPTSSQSPLSLKTTGEPVDVVTGDVVMNQVDVGLPGALPLVLERAHRSGYRTGRWLGRSWVSSLDERLEVTPDGVFLAVGDGSVLAYPNPASDGELVWPPSGARWPLTREEDGYTVTDPRTGTVRRFEPRPGYDMSAQGHRELPLVSVTSRAGHQIAFSYGPDGAPVSVTHDGGYQVNVEVAGGLVAGLALAGAGPDGRDVTLVRYGYDEAGNLAEVVNSSGAPLRFSYDPAGRLAGWQDRNGWWYRYHYDAMGRCVRGEGPDGVLADTFAYDPERRVTTHTDAVGATTVYQLSTRHRVAAQTDPLGHVTRTDYDTYGQLVSQVDALGRVTRWAYDQAGNLTCSTRADGSQSTAAYNEQNLPVVITQADGARWEQEFDERGNLVRATGPDGAVTSHSYDERGNLAAVIDPAGAITRVECSPAGLPVLVTAPDGAITRYERDAFGHATAVTDPDGRVTRLEWTTGGLLAARIFADGTAERYTYDGEDNLVEHLDSAGGVTRLEYGFLDQLATRTGPDGTRTELRYDPALRLTSVTHAGLTWRYEYDPAGRLVAQTDYNGATTRYDLDAVGQVTRRANAAGQQLSYAYDPLGNLTDQHAEAAVTSFGYDAAGRLIRAASPDAVVELERDVAGRIIAETCNGRTVQSGYDAAGQRVLRVTPSGAETRWDYNEAGRPVALSAAGQELRFGYDPAGRETLRQLPGGVRLSQEWDAAGQLAAQVLTGPGPGQVLQRRAYTYGDDGLLTGVEDLLTGPRRLTLDRAGQVTGVTGPDWAESYGYDPAGNITAAAWPASPAAPGTPASAATADGPGAEGPREYTGTVITRAGDIRYEHDQAGRITLRQQARLSRKPDTWRYEWDASDRLTAVTTPDGTRWQYAYDPFGRRIAKQRVSPDGQASEHTSFTWDGSLLAEQTTADADDPAAGHVTTWDYHPGTFMPLTQIEHWRGAPQEQVDQKFYSIVTDLIETPAELVAADGELAGHQQRTLWGIGYWAGAATPLRFPGQYADDESGLHYNDHRYYDPVTGRYLTADRLGLTPAPNPHTYVTNPNALADPLGLGPCSVIAGLIRSSASPNKVVVIGRTMTRVKAAVKALQDEGINAKWYQAWKNDPFDPDLAMSRNTRWINDKMDQGYTIVDIGPDLSRSDPVGPFYGMESKAVSGAGYPTIPMSWPSSP
jgi:RHS repeat-associated protein